MKVGFLGAGFMGITHAKSLSKLEGMECVCLCGNTNVDEKVKEFSEATGMEMKGYIDFDLMLEENELDMLVVAIPPFAHNGQVEKAAKKGIHIFMEKPIALTIDRAESMCEAINKAGVKSQVGYHMRFGDAVKRVKELLDDKDTIITSYQASYECNALHGPWWRDKEKSGGQTLEQIIHLYDMSMYLCGTPKKVSGVMANLCHKDIEDYTVEDTSAALLQFESGAVATLAGSNCAIPWQWNGIFKLITNKFVAEFKNHNEAKITFTEDDSNITVEEINGETDVYFDEIKYFVDVLKGEKENICTVDEGLASLKLVQRVTESAQKGGESMNY